MRISLSQLRLGRDGLRSFLWASLCAGFLVGCQSQPRPHVPVAQSAPAPAVLDLRLVFVDDNHRPIDSPFNPKGAALMFPYISGQFFGRASGAPLDFKHISADRRFSLPLSQWQTTLADAAEPLTGAPATEANPLSADPPGARLARVGTFAFDLGTARPLGGGGFMDSLTGDLLVLVYVDRPCVLEGVSQADGVSYAFETVRFAEGGLHWVRIASEGAERYMVRNAKPQGEIVFIVTREDLRAT